MKIIKLCIALFICLNAYAAKEQNNSQITNDIEFWAGQSQEHAEFAADFTQDPILQQRGLEFAQAFKNFKHKNGNKNSQKEFLALCKKFDQYLKEVYNRLKAGLEKDIVDHMRLETGYAQKKAQGKKLSKREEVQFWSQEHEGEAHVLNTLMNPNAPKLKEKTEQLEKDLKSNAHMWKDSLQVVEQANKELDAIGNTLEKDPIKNDISEKLAQHEKRERERAAQTFKKLKLQK